MTPAELTAILDASVLSLADILSFFLGSVTGVAFVVSSCLRWDS